MVGSFEALNFLTTFKKKARVDFCKTSCNNKQQKRFHAIYVCDFAQNRGSYFIIGRKTNVKEQFSGI